MNEESPITNPAFAQTDRPGSKTQVRPGHNSEPIIRISNVNKIFRVGRNRIKALDNISLEIRKGEFVALQGASGAGKSTLLHIIGGLERAESGKIMVNGSQLQRMSEDELTLFRRNDVGFVFQFFNLIPSLTAVENVLISQLFDRELDDEATWGRATELLERMGLKKRITHKPSELSGGEQQRVAIARALFNKPVLLLADEPTGNIDSEAGSKIIQLFKELGRGGTTIVLATHDQDVAAAAGRKILMKDGKLMK